MIVYRKAPQLRLRRSAAPEPPWWAATAIAPYGGRRALPIAIDYLDLHATSGERLDVTVAENPRDQIERMSSPFAPPVIVDCAEAAEGVFRRGEETLGLLAEWKLPSMLLVSAGNEITLTPDVVVVAAWPADPDRLATTAASLRGKEWGIAIPIVFPSTTDLDLLTRLRDVGAEHGARFFAGIPIEVDATARQALAQGLTMPDDEETFNQLFHADLEPLGIATERHIAALAAEAKMADFVVPPRWNETSNWNAATLLTLTATRMLAMESDVELAGTMARSARLVATLDKPLQRIAEAASLSIVEGLDEASADVLSDWLAGSESPFVRRVNEAWRLRRDAGMKDER
ncbi:MAG TPA: hypothetical protein VF057_12225 [Thermoanaerobaculia bacterium]